MNIHRIYAVLVPVVLLYTISILVYSICIRLHDTQCVEVYLQLLLLLFSVRYDRFTSAFDIAHGAPTSYGTFYALHYTHALIESPCFHKWWMDWD